LLKTGGDVQLLGRADKRNAGITAPTGDRPSVASR
jgi:hypothetical protein